MRAFFNDMAGVQELIPLLEETIQEALKETEPDNPIYRVAEGKVMREVVAKGDAEKYILNRLNNIEDLLGRIDTRDSSQAPLFEQAYSSNASLTELIHLALALEENGLPVRELASRIGSDYNQVRAKISRMLRAGMVERVVKDGQPAIYKLRVESKEDA